MFAAEMKAALSDLPLGGLRVFQTIGSTNDEALYWAKHGAPDLSLVIADEQTAGRGRLDRQWLTPAGAGLALSLIVKPTPRTAAPEGRLAGLGALAVADACARLGLQASIKWPNDVLVGGRKLAGVLVESVWSGDVLDASVVGIGANVLRSSSPADDEVSFPATSIEAQLGRTPDRRTFLRDLASALLAWRARLADEEFLRAWSDRLAFRDQMVIVSGGNQASLSGRVVGLSTDGSLRLDCEGRIIEVQVGELQLRPTNDRIG